MYIKKPKPYDKMNYKGSVFKGNKISEFLQSEFVRDMFPEHNDHTTDPNYRGNLQMMPSSKPFFYI